MADDEQTPLLSIQFSPERKGSRSADWSEDPDFADVPRWCAASYFWCAGLGTMVVVAVACWTVYVLSYSVIRPNVALRASMLVLAGITTFYVFVGLAAVLTLRLMRFSVADVLRTWVM